MSTQPELRVGVGVEPVSTQQSVQKQLNDKYKDLKVSVGLGLPSRDDFQRSIREAYMKDGRPLGSVRIGATITPESLNEMAARVQEKISSMTFKVKVQLDDKGELIKDGQLSLKAPKSPGNSNESVDLGKEISLQEKSAAVIRVLTGQYRELKKARDNIRKSGKVVPDTVNTELTNLEKRLQEIRGRHQKNDFNYVLGAEEDFNKMVNAVGGSLDFELNQLNNIRLRLGLLVDLENRRNKAISERTKIENKVGNKSPEYDAIDTLIKKLDEAIVKVQELRGQGVNLIPVLSDILGGNGGLGYDLYTEDVIDATTLKKTLDYILGETTRAERALAEQTADAQKKTSDSITTEQEKAQRAIEETTHTLKKLKEAQEAVTKSGGDGSLIANEIGTIETALKGMEANYKGGAFGKVAAAESAVKAAAESANKALQDRQETIDKLNAKQEIYNKLIAGSKKAQEEYQRISSKVGKEDSAAKEAAKLVGQYQSLISRIENNEDIDFQKALSAFDFDPNIKAEIKDWDSLFKQLALTINLLSNKRIDISIGDLDEKAVLRRTKAIQNLQRQINSYLEANPRIEKNQGLWHEFHDILGKLDGDIVKLDDKELGNLTSNFYKLRNEAQQLGLEAEDLLGLFEKLFGQHFGTAIVMSAIHILQDGLR